MARKKRETAAARGDLFDKLTDSDDGVGTAAGGADPAGGNRTDAEPIYVDRQQPDSAHEANADLADLDTQVAELNDRNLRLQAEMENLRQRTAREIRDERRYAAMPLVRDILDVVDNVDRAIQAAEQTADAESVLEGLRLVAQQLQGTLAKHNCKSIDAIGEPFDPNLHEAIQQMPSEEQPAGNVSLVTQVGYQLHDRVVRPSQVIISTGAAEA